ncbi:MAG TPA: 5-formyltetrahydrofolate cyclo-ligase [Ilumatobacteraceae bacterium]|nr:5-formyltetrahydrofolate cyclo-ligase [Ilumatobacteraceae bacterium]
MSAAAAAEKAALRRRMKLVRETVDDHLMRSVELWAQVADLPEYSDATTVMAFNGMGSEPDTDPLLARIAADGKRALLPRVEQGRLVVCDADGEMATSSFGVVEPQGPALDPSVVEFVVVPGLAFTTDGCRLGYGAGYYDGFLSTIPGVPNAGVCFAEQLVDTLPMEPHDIRVQRVVTA